MKIKSIFLIASLAATPVFAGGTIGGSTGTRVDRPSPDEVVILCKHDFRNLARDVVGNSNQPVVVNGRSARPLFINLQSKTIHLESLDKKIIEVNEEE